MEFSGSATLLKKTPIQVFSCEIYKLFKSNYFVEDFSHEKRKEQSLNAYFQTLFKKRLKRRCFPVNFVNYFCGSFFNKVTSQTGWRLLTVLERDCRTCTSLWILRNFWEIFFPEHLLATISYMMLLFSLFLQISEAWSLNLIY